MHLRILAPRASSLPSLPSPSQGDTHPDPVRQYLALLYQAPADPQPRERPPARDMPYAPQAMPALLETRGYTALRTAVLHATPSINSQGRAPVGLRPELPRLPGGRLQLTATIHVRPCSPARTNTTVFQRPSWNRQKGLGRSCTMYPQGRRSIPQRSNWKLATGRKERRKEKV